MQHHKSFIKDVFSYIIIIGLPFNEANKNKMCDLQHWLPEQHVEHAVVEDGELAHDLRGGGRAREPHQRAARQRADTVSVRQRGLGLDQLRTR